MTDKKVDANALPSSLAFELGSPNSPLDLDSGMQDGQGSENDGGRSAAFASKVSLAFDSDCQLDHEKMAWRGMADSEPALELTQKKRLPQADLDMTSMVDVTFLLLIFFMITASFTLQRSIEQPKASEAQPGSVIELEAVEVKIDANNIFYVSAAGRVDIECPSESEMRTQVKAGLSSVASQQLIITAHPDSSHQSVIRVWDAGVVCGASQIKIKSISELD